MLLIGLRCYNIIIGESSPCDSGVILLRAADDTSVSRPHAPDWARKFQNNIPEVNELLTQSLEFGTQPVEYTFSTKLLLKSGIHTTGEVYPTQVGHSSHGRCRFSARGRAMSVAWGFLSGSGAGPRSGCCTSKRQSQFRTCRSGGAWVALEAFLGML